MAIRYYGRDLGEEHFKGRLGTLVRGCNAARAFLERQTEALTALYLAREQGVSLPGTLRSLTNEGLWRPIPIAVSPPVIPDRAPVADADGRFYNTRDYSARVGRRRENAIHQAEKPSGGSSIFERYLPGVCANRFRHPVTIVEGFDKA